MGRIKKIIAEFELEKEDSSLMLNSQQVYNWIGEETEEDCELAMFIDKYCTYLNWYVGGLHNEEMAFGDTEYNRLIGWLDGYVFAKKYDVTTKGSSIKIVTKRFIFILPKPFDI